MLSKHDIYKELGKGINIVPLIDENIKENSINVTISNYAWTTGAGTVCWCGKDEFHLETMLPIGTKKQRSHVFHKGSKAIFFIKHKDGTKKDYLILLPHQTTIIETKEVLGLGECIGGAIHSKVGIVAKGIGDTGTMLGPGYCGHLMLSLHNITDDVIALPIDTTFVSLTFDELKTPVKRTSSTSSSHYDKLLELGMQLTEEDRRYFSQDWKCNLGEIRSKLKEANAFINLKKKYRKARISALREWFSWRRILAIVLILLVVISIGLIASYIDQKHNVSIWTDRYWTILIASICSFIIPTFLSKIFSK